MRALCVEPSVPTKPCSNRDASFSSPHYQGIPATTRRRSQRLGVSPTFMVVWTIVTAAGGRLPSAAAAEPHGACAALSDGTGCAGRPGPSISSNGHSSSNSLSSRHSSSMCTHTFPYPITKLLPPPHQHGPPSVAEVPSTVSPLGRITWQQPHADTSHGFSTSLLSLPIPPSLIALCAPEPILCSGKSSHGGPISSVMA